MFGEEKGRERFGNGDLLNGGRRWAEPLGWEILKVLGQNFSEMEGTWTNIRFSANFVIFFFFLSGTDVAPCHIRLVVARS